MPIVYYNTALAAGANANVLNNSTLVSIYETLPFNALVEFAAVGSAAGLTMFASTGTTILAESGTPIGVPQVAGRPPIYPDDFHLNDVARAGERIKFLISNPTAGALTPFAAVRITPI